MMKKKSKMTSDRVVDLYSWFKENGIAIWIAGGWCTDALLGKQTREHADLDIAVHRKDSAKLRKLLENNGYREEKRADSSEYMYVMENVAGQVIDIHAFEYDRNGKIIYGIEFPFGSLTGIGIIDGHEVNCIEPNFMFKFITCYEPKEKDWKDIRALSEKFGFELPNR